MTQAPNATPPVALAADGGEVEREDTRIGGVTWVSSEADGGPDVGISVFLGDGKRLWCGEISHRVFMECGGAEHFIADGGHYIVMYDPSPKLIAKAGDNDDAREFIEWVAALQVLLASAQELGKAHSNGIVEVIHQRDDLRARLDAAERVIAGLREGFAAALREDRCGHTMPSGQAVEEWIDRVIKDANARATRATAELELQRGWRTMESAPKDETFIILRFEGHGELRVCGGFWSESDNDWFESEASSHSMTSFYGQPIGWVPAPKE